MPRETPLQARLRWPTFWALPLLLAAGVAAHAQAAPLTAADLVWPKLPEDADSTVVRRVLGPPDARDIWFTSSDGEQAPRWRYARYNVYYDVSANAMIALELTGRGPATRRGLQVGDALGRVRALYGPPGDEEDTEPQDGQVDTWRYHGPTGVLTLKIRRGRVGAIVIGSSLTNE